MTEISTESQTMSDSFAAADTGLRSTDVSFGVRTMLLVTVPVAMIASVAGWFMRSIPPEERARVAVAWTMWLAILVAWIAVAAGRRIRFEKRAGRAIMRLPIYGGNPDWRLFNRWVLSGALVLFGFLGLFWSAAIAMQAQTIVGTVWAVLNFGSLTLAGLAAYSVTLWWWGRDIRLCEAGVLWDRRIIPWSEVHERWDPDRDTLTLSGLDLHQVRLVCAVLVPEQRREAVLALLQEKIPLLQEKIRRLRQNEFKSVQETAEERRE
jgi:hypothetical protein